MILINVKLIKSSFGNRNTGKEAFLESISFLRKNNVFYGYFVEISATSNSIVIDGKPKYYRSESILKSILFS